MKPAPCPVSRFWRALVSSARERGHLQQDVALALHLSEPTLSRRLRNSGLPGVPPWREVEAAVNCLGLQSEREYFGRLWLDALGHTFDVRIETASFRARKEA